MSPSNWFKEKKSVKSSGKLQIKNYSNGIKTLKGTTNLNESAADLFSDIRDVINENNQLQIENTSLRTDLEDLRNRHDNLVKSIKANRVKFEENLHKLQEEIRLNESDLIDNNKKCLAQQKKYVEEIKELKLENGNLKIDLANNKSMYEEEKKTIKLLQLGNTSVNNQNEELVKKSNRYKSKLKYAITIINDLNNILIGNTIKPDTSNIQIQTELEISNENLSLNSRCSPSSSRGNSRSHFENENILLSDIFFKSKSFCDSELFLFNKDDSTVNVSRNSSGDVSSN
ncbi:hypothetical protein JTB14_013943 [Gonioctena quinquepunctata]|nr:hypothetical protein JTB14_013943 [Gonioctena quinquepunctata]